MGRFSTGNFFGITVFVGFGISPSSISPSSINPITDWPMATPAISNAASI